MRNLPGAPVGQVSTRLGLICSSESQFETTIQGQGGRVAMLQACRDAITVGGELAQDLQTIASRKLRLGASVVVSVTEFQTGSQRNVFAGTETLKGDACARSPEN